jgi:hypothetical protein
MPIALEAHISVVALDFNCALIQRLDRPFQDALLPEAPARSIGVVDGKREVGFTRDREVNVFLA